LIDKCFCGEAGDTYKLTPEQLRELPFRYGPEDAKILIIGEAPGSEEANHPQSKPFVGQSGQLLRSIFRKKGVDLDDCWVTNLIKLRPENNKLLPWIAKNPDIYKNHLDILEQELLTAKPNIIVPCGAVALSVVCKLKGITNWRGSIVESKFRHLTGIKCIPIIHPAAILRNWKDFFPPTPIDIERIVEESSFPEINLPKRNYIIRPTFDQCLEYIEECMIRKDCLIGCDTESHFGKIVSVQLSYAKDSAICIPFQSRKGNYYFPPEQELVLWKSLFNLLENCGKRLIGQNFIAFDVFMFAMHGGNWQKIYNNVYFDTMYASQTLQPELPKGLDFLTSIYTKEPYYKGEGKEWDSRHGEEEFWTYGCKDAAILHEIQEQQEEELKEENLWNIFQTRYMEMSGKQLAMSLRGLPLDSTKRKELAFKFEVEITRLHAQLTHLIGEVLNVRSTPQMREFLYDKLKLKPKYTHKGTKSVDKYVLYDTLSKDPDQESLKLILKIREKRTLYSNDIRIRVDSDGKARTTYGFTETGRFTSKKCPLGTGSNLQNITSDMRVMYAAPKGKVYLAADGSQAEARIVGYRGQDPVMIDVFESGKDIHNETASAIFECAVSEVNKDQRYTGKRTNHASNYDMSYKKFVQVYNEDAIKYGTKVIQYADGKHYMAVYHQKYINIRGVYQAQIKHQVKTTKTLTNPFGRRMIFHDRVGPELFRSAYAWYAQSTIADFTNMVLTAIFDDMYCVHQMHDGILILCSPNEVNDAIELITEAAKIPIFVEGYAKPVYIPVDFKVGDNWKDMHDVSFDIKEAPVETVAV
jgi:uracil-DNA glycosylase family 4